jgi:hypothetical protein
MAAFPAIRIEGGLLGTEILDQLLAGELPGQRSADFELDARRNLTDEIAGAFADARALWGVFQHRLDRLGEDDPATTETRDFWAIPLFRLLGYKPQYNPRAQEIDGQSFWVFYRANEAADAPPVHIVGARQELGRVPASGRPRLAPHSLVQEYLNRTEHAWGVVTNGPVLRLLRNCTFVRRQAYVEFDLRSIIAEQRFNDFQALYRLLHRTRLPRGAGGECLLDQYYARSQEQGGRVREHLRDGVEECIRRLANGFLRHPANEAMRRRLSPDGAAVGRLDAQLLYRQLLRLVYRLLFLLVSEDRGLLSADPVYAAHYGIARLRRLLDGRAAYTADDDLWQSLRVLWRVLADEKLAPLLGLPPLNGELFVPTDLDRWTITNRELLEAFWHLAWYREDAAPPRRVNYAALDVEELGSVYESLLDFHPMITADGAGRPVFDLVEGSERKTTGSYYTPHELVAEIVKSALDPVIADRLGDALAAEREKALLSIRVCDPACGSGHFLLAAARRLGREIARLRTGEDEPAPERVREATREAIAYCLYGVDKNPLAVDLCRVALWLESNTGDKPLTFLDHRIRCGDALIGVFNLAVLKAGIPDKAFNPLEGDHRDTARALKRRNRSERSGQRELLDWQPAKSIGAFAVLSQAIDAIGDDTPEALREKRRLFAQGHANPAWQRLLQACDLWTAAFFQPLAPGKPAITAAALLDHLDGRPLPLRLTDLAFELSEGNGFFHWPLEFPEVFARGGFDVLLSNPPWERVKLQEQEFFAVHDRRIANAPNKAARAKLIRELPETNPVLDALYREALRSAGAGSAFLRHGGGFPLAGRGDINTYAVFAELAANAINPTGRAGLILPTGIATDDTTKLLFGSLVQRRRLHQLIGFENEEHIFPAVHHFTKFCNFTIAGGAVEAEQTRLAFYIRRFSQLSEEQRFFSLAPIDFALLNPNTGTCPIFRTEADAELTKAIYRRVPILWREAQGNQPEVNPWRLSFSRMFDMANDSHMFRTAHQVTGEGCRLDGNVFVGADDRYLPLYEAKMLHQFDHRYSTYEGATQRQLNVGILPRPLPEQKRDPGYAVQPRYWVREDLVDAAMPRWPEPLAAALDASNTRTMRYVLSLWAAGFCIERNRPDEARQLLQRATTITFDDAASLAATTEDSLRFQNGFPLTEQEAKAVIERPDEPKALAAGLVERFSPKWLIGWRDITNATNERTLIASALPKAAVGDKFLLMFSKLSPELRLCLLANFDSFALDYAARQKIGGTSMKYFTVRQLPVIPPAIFLGPAAWAPNERIGDWIACRAFELQYTANNLRALADDRGFSAPPFGWDEARRFEMRCELDAAFFHLYLPAEHNGIWREAPEETPAQLAELRRHFPIPRDAVGHILDQFPGVRQKDEQLFKGRYRTKERIIEIYDAMLAAIRFGMTYRTTLDPPPGTPVSVSTQAAAQ